MITSGSLPNYKNSVCDITVYIESPLSGFELSLMETGILASADAFKTANLVTFSGKEGYLFDQSGNFFGGYESGKPFGLKVFYDFDNSRFSYQHNNLLVANGLDVTGYSVFETGNVNCVMFNKYAGSTFSISISGAIS